MCDGLRLLGDEGSSWGVPGISRWILCGTAEARTCVVQLSKPIRQLQQGSRKNGRNQGSSGEHCGGLLPEPEGSDRPVCPAGQPAAGRSGKRTRLWGIRDADEADRKRQSAQKSTREPHLLSTEAWRGRGDPDLVQAPEDYGRRNFLCLPGQHFYCGKLHSQVRELHSFSVSGCS